MSLKSRSSLTCFRVCFLPGRVKDLSASRYSCLIINLKGRNMQHFIKMQLFFCNKMVLLNEIIFIICLRNRCCLSKVGVVVHGISPWHRGYKTALYLPVRFYLLIRNCHVVFLYITLWTRSYYPPSVYGCTLKFDFIVLELKAPVSASDKKSSLTLCPQNAL